MSSQVRGGGGFGAAVRARVENLLNSKKSDESKESLLAGASGGGKNYGVMGATETATTSNSPQQRQQSPLQERLLQQASTEPPLGSLNGENVGLSPVISSVPVLPQVASVSDEITALRGKFATAKEQLDALPRGVKEECEVMPFNAAKHGVSLANVEKRALSQQGGINSLLKVPLPKIDNTEHQLIQQCSASCFSSLQNNIARLQASPQQDALVHKEMLTDQRLNGFLQPIVETFGIQDKLGSLAAIKLQQNKTEIAMVFAYGKGDGYKEIKITYTKDMQRLNIAVTGENITYDFSYALGADKTWNIYSECITTVNAVNTRIGEMRIIADDGGTITYNGVLNRGIMTALPSGVGRVSVDGSSTSFMGEFVEGKMHGQCVGQVFAADRSRTPIVMRPLVTYTGNWVDGVFKANQGQVIFKETMDGQLQFVDLAAKAAQA